MTGLSIHESLVFLDQTIVFIQSTKVESAGMIEATGKKRVAIPQTCVN